ncbi:MAG: leucine-rich repeat protein [Clostridiales bacterium]|nr:leucine-rich repeat protein [Clostridiales bacterium]
MSDKLSQLICRVCGGTLDSQPNGAYICLNCGAKYENLSVSSEKHILLINAYDTLRRGEFDEAEEAFSNIINSDPGNYSAYWGRALSRFGIIFVDDLLEKKKVPTCHNISERCFVEDPDYIKAVEYAPEQIAKNYKLLAKKIEIIRVEWLEKARKEPDYDVFICYKDSDKEAGLERTPDSYEAQNLYTHLTRLGYNVFFSRESLRDKISEYYEPYIYNALKTAKVMVVYGQNPDYFRATWVKNEWNRFAKLINEGEKHPSSLVVAYENFDPSLLPQQLKIRQCMDAGKKTFYGDLEAHIKKIIEMLSPKESKIQRIQIKGGKIAKKAKQIDTNAIQMKTLSVGLLGDISLSEKKKATIIRRFIKNDMFSEAKSLLEDMLRENPNSPEGLFFKLLFDNHIRTEEEFKNLSEFRDFATLDSILDVADSELGAKTLDMFYALASNLLSKNPQNAAQIIEHIVPYIYENRTKNIKELFNVASENVITDVFEVLLRSIDKEDVDSYIEKLINFADSALKKNQYAVAKLYYTRALKLDEGNTVCLRGIIRTNTLSPLPSALRQYDATLSKMSDADYKDFENLLRYLPKDELKDEVTAALHGLLDMQYLNDEAVKVFMQLLRYYPGELKELKEELSAVSVKCVKSRLFDQAIYFLNLQLGFDEDDPAIYWNLIKAKSRCAFDSELVRSPIKLSSLKEFNMFLAVANEQQLDACIKIVKLQDEYIKQTKVNKDEPKKLKNNKNKIKPTKDKKRSVENGLRVAAAMSLLIFIICTLRNALFDWNPSLIARQYLSPLKASFAFQLISYFTMVGSMLGLVIIERKKSKDLKKKRKLTPRVLLLILAILSMPVSASFIKYNNIINGDYVQNGFVIKDLGNEAWIVKYEGSSEEIDLENLETKIYRNISAICDSAFENNQKIKKVTLTKNIRLVGKSAFKNCVNLESVTRLSTSEALTIDDNAFQNCYKLSELKVGKIYYIGDRAFSNCKSILTIDIGFCNYIGDRAFEWWTSEQTIYY